MKNENLAGSTWKERLEDVNELPGYVLQDKHIAWEKLDVRLHKTKAVKSPVWYWIAAACLLVAIAFVFIQPGKKNEVVVADKASKPVKNIITSQPAIKENINTKSNKSSTGKKETIVSNHKKTLNNTVIKIEKKIKDSALQSPVILQEIPTAATIVKDSGVQTAIAVVPLQKKMKVAHINELDEDGFMNRVQTQKHLPARIKFLNQDIYTDYTVKSAGSGFNILKLHNTPSN